MHSWRLPSVITTECPDVSFRRAIRFAESSVTFRDAMTVSGRLTPIDVGGIAGPQLIVKEVVATTAMPLASAISSGVVHRLDIAISLLSRQTSGHTSTERKSPTRNHSHARRDT